MYNYVYFCINVEALCIIGKTLCYFSVGGAKYSNEVFPDVLLSHVRNHLSVQSTRALMCLGVWSLMDLVKDKDIMAAALLPEVDGEEEELAEDWDTI